MSVCVCQHCCPPPPPPPPTHTHTHTVVSIGFDPIAYQVREDDGSVVVTVKVLSGDLSSPVTVNLATFEASATGMNDMECSAYETIQ